MPPEVMWNNNQIHLRNSQATLGHVCCVFIVKSHIYTKHIGYIYTSLAYFIILNFFSICDY